MADLARAALFLLRNGRLLERHVFATLVQGASPEHVIDALRAYQNDDGGFGNALEPDLRGPDSQPIHVDFALRVLRDVGVAPPEMVARACSYLTTLSVDGGVPAITESVLSSPHGEHWQPASWTADALNPTAMMAGLLHALHVGNAWLTAADAFVWRRLTEVKLADGPALAAVMCFLNNAPDRRRAVMLAEEVADAIPEADFFALDPEDLRGGYALTPLDLAPTPDALVGSLFAPELIAAHLDALDALQQPDGGWPITWEAPAGIAAMEYRGRMTVEAIGRLKAYGRI